MFHYFLKHEFRVPLWTLAGASLIGGILVTTRMLLTLRSDHTYLVWNLFLAWVPVLLALRVDALERRREIAGWRFWATGLAWLLFFPNAPYICTDLSHLKPIMQARWWTDLILILLFAVIGLVLSFISLRQMQNVVARWRGRCVSWIFVGGVALLSGFGVYLGRFERWNSWDVIVRPFALFADSINWMHRSSLKFTILFGIFIFTAYVLLYSLTALAPMPAVAKVPKQ